MDHRKNVQEKEIRYVFIVKKNIFLFLYKTLDGFRSRVGVVLGNAIAIIFTAIGAIIAAVISLTGLGIFMAYYIIAYFIFSILSYKKKGKFGIAMWDGLKDPIVKPIQFIIGLFRKKK